MIKEQLIPNLFRSEYGKIVAVLSSYLGIHNIDKAEDITSDTFLVAMDTWPYKGVPPNPTAWLYTVAKNKALNFIKRENTFSQKVSASIKSSITTIDDIDLGEKNISDSQLKMLFTVCHPAISEESQIGLALRILCGFGIDEIANAFLTTKSTINKRLQRAKSVLRNKNIQLELPEEPELNNRLETVLRTIYLLFSEGYYSESNSAIIRKELCLEAVNLCYLLLKCPNTNTHSTNSLMALMCFHSSRLEARQNNKGDLILYQDQDEAMWNTELIEKGFHYLQMASQWEVKSKYYIEGSIAYWHTVKEDKKDKWESILKLYDALIKIDTSSIVQLNRIYAFSKVNGEKEAILEAEQLPPSGNHFYHLLLAELNKDIDKNMAKIHLTKALTLCKFDEEKKLIQRKIEAFSN
uniref:RNA polymerase sigma factor n=1 Tax=Fulvivirga sp. TaxID=1931237 RepID=UPI004048F8F6